MPCKKAREIEQQQAIVDQLEGGATRSEGNGCAGAGSGEISCFSPAAADDSGVRM